MPPLVWITGAHGLIGSQLVQSAPQRAPGVVARGLSRQEVDLTHHENVTRLFLSEKPDYIIHCAALSQSPACDKYPDLAHQVNVEATRHLVRLIQTTSNTRLLFFSTDLVFDGTRGSYREEDPVSPLGIYPQTKIQAENCVRQAPRTTILRVSLNASFQGGFLKGMLEAWRKGQDLALFEDEFRSPIPVETTARAVWEMVHKRLEGTFHLAGSERLSRLQIGEHLARQFPSLNPRFHATSLSTYEGSPRPPDTSLDCSKLQQHLSFPLPGFRDWITAQTSFPIP